MRNLKRVLSLALALVMMLSLMIVGASAAEVKKADFTDQDEITYNEAVDVMVALEVIEGTDTGAFNPKGVLTREAAAKILCYMLLGPTNAENLTTNTSIFTDVAAGRWSAGYISYCANLGILAGTGDGSFNPEGELTGVAFGKMLLVALGYDPAIEGYVGKDWATAIASDMVDAGIAVNGVVLSEPLTREQAAQMSFQTLEADMVRYANKGTTVNTTDGTSVIVGASDATPVSNTSTDYTQSNGKYIANTSTDSVQQFCEKYFPKLTKADDNDNFQRPGGVWKLGSAEICFSADDPVATFTGKFSKKELYNALSNNIVKDIIAGDTNAFYYVNGYDGGSGTEYDGVWAGSAYDFGIDDLTSSERTKTAKELGANGLLTEIYVADNNDVTVVMSYTYLVQATDDYDADKGELKIEDVSSNSPSLTGTLSSDDVTGLAAFEEDDYILVTATTTDGSNYTVETVAAPETVNGEVTSYVKSGTKSVTVNGVKYTYSVSEKTEDASGKTYTINDTEYTLILDPYGYVMYAEGAKGSDSYVFINEFGKSGSLTINSDTVADAIFPDGTRETITAKDVYQSDGTTNLDYHTGDSSERGWYSYTVKDGKYTLTQLASTKATAPVKGTPSAGTEITTNGTPAVNGKTGTNSTVYVVLNGKKVTTYTGYKTVPTVTAGTGAYVSTVYNNNNYAQYVFVNVGSGGNIAGGATSDLIFILEAGTENVDADGSFWTYSAIVNGEKTTIESTKGSLGQGLYRDPSYDGDRLDNATQIRESTGDYVVNGSVDGTVTQGSGVVTIAGTAYKVTDDCDIKTISSNGKTVTSYTTARLASTYKTEHLAGVLYGVKDKDGYYTTLYIHLGAVDPAPSGAADVTLSASFVKGHEDNTGTVASVEAVLGTESNAQKIYVTFGAVENLSNTADKVDKLVITGTTDSTGAEMVDAHSSITLKWNGTDGWTADTTDENNTIQVKAEDGTIVKYTFESAKSTDASLEAAYGDYTEGSGGSETASGDADVTVTIDSENPSIGTITITTDQISNAEDGDEFIVNLTKGFSKATMTDDATQPSAVTKLTITFDGSDWSSDLDTVVVTAEDGATVVTYTVSVDPDPT